MAGKASTSWNAGKGRGWTDDRGYRWLSVLENGKRVQRQEHRHVMEVHLGRRLEPWEVVHHKDENPRNNSLENLEVKDAGTHSAEHGAGRRQTWESKRRNAAHALMRLELRRCRARNAELLAALEWATKQIGILSQYIETPEALAKFDQCRAAIAKAKGEDHAV